MKLNIAVKQHTHEGARGVALDAESQLRRSVMACMLWEDSFYENGQEIGKRIAELVAQVRPEFAAACAFHARTDMKLRHAPLLIIREMARLPKHKALVAHLLADTIQRPDELTEFLAIYWKDKRQPLSAQVKKGLARAFRKFNEYSLGKYDRDGPVKLRDVLFLSHAKPADTEQEKLFKKVVDRKLATPDTWEVALSAGDDKKRTFERLMAEGHLGALAFIRNLRNMKEAGVGKETVAEYASKVNVERVLPFRFIAAARACPGWEDIIESMMLRCLEGQTKLSGKTAIVVDNSGSMHGARVSAKSDMDRSDAACALAILVREVCEDCVVVGFGSHAAVVPARRGFALADAIKRGPGGGTDTRAAVSLAAREGYDRIVVITDEQSHTAISAPSGVGYFVNVAMYKNGIGYGPWTHIDGWSEAILDYIREAEAQ
jgi:hypothetical protein